MKAAEYQKLALRTASGERNESVEDKLLNGILGLVGEVGEIVDHIKKALFQGHELDSDKVADESGDVLWYISLISHAIGIPMEEIMNRNIEKLKIRFPDGFDTERSINRK